MATTPRPVGRPHEFDQTVSVRLTTALHDTLSLEALHRDMTLSDLIRERLEVDFVSQNSDASENLLP
jgi:predicted HicB family RNase H-like nuclease